MYKKQRDVDPFYLGVRSMSISSTSSVTPLRQEDFESSVRNGESWLMQAEQFLLAAEVLIPNIKSNGPRSAESISRRVGCLKSALLLLAVSVENSLKAIKAQNGEIIVLKGVIKKESFGNKSGHNLTSLAKSTEIKLSSDEEGLLTQLTEVLLWAGKYQHPLNAEAFGKAKNKNPRTLTFPRDADLARGVYEKAKKIVESHASSPA